MFPKMHKKVQLTGSWHRLIRAVEYMCLFHLIPESSNLVLKAVIMSHNTISFIAG